MSLHPDVQNLAAQGRNGDSMLLHVTPDEVQGLHQLALMHGTKMTINPVTGLPEANFMKDWLPVIVGGLATIATGGMAAPFMIGAGALTAFGTSMAVGNSFKKSLFTGLMAGAGGALGAGLGAAGGAAAGGVGTTIGTVAAEAAPGVFGAAGRGIASQALTKGISAGATEAAAGGLGGFASTQGANLASGAGRFGAQEAQALMRTEAQQIAQNATQKSFQEAGKIAADNARRPMINQFGQMIDPAKISSVQTGIGPVRSLTNAQAMANPEFSRVASLQGLKPGYTAPMGQPLPANIGPASYGAPPSSIMPPPSITPPAPQSYMSGVSDALSAQGRGVNKLFEPGEFSKFAGNNKLALAGLGIGGMGMMSSDQQKIKPATAHGDYYSYPGFTQGYDPTGGASGQQYFNYGYGTPTVTHYAEGGSIGDEVNNVMYPQSQLPSGAAGQYGNRSAVPVPREVVGAQDAVVNPFTGAEGMAAGGIATLGGYSDGGRLTQGPGDGVSDSIPASIGGKQPARLADGEFVIPARIVSEIGNGSTKAGAKKLYAMMDRIQKARRKTKDIAANTRADRFMPA
jgi:hypothetical protein